MSQDIWHFPRNDMAKQVLGMFEIGLSSALIFFAARRMGKTEFLRKDMQPLANSRGWQTLYFSFLDVEKNSQEEFALALVRFAEKIGIRVNSLEFFKRIKRISGSVKGVEAAIELGDPDTAKTSMKEIFEALYTKKKILLLLDEAQVLAKQESNQPFIAGLRTALDLYKDNVKVIFTGSSRDGLRRMFSKGSAPFFHFGQNLPFPELGREFTDHLATQFNVITKQQLNKDQLWEIFLEMNRVPQLLRSLVERIILNPSYDIEELKTQLLDEVYNDRAFAEGWDECSLLERLILLRISTNAGALFSQSVREEFSKKLGVSLIPVSSIQSSLRTLVRKSIVGRLPEWGEYFIEDPNFKSWIIEEK